MDKALLRALRARGVDATSALEAHKIEIPDEEHLLFAASEGRALFSFNVGDYFRLHAAFLRQGKDHAGIVLSRQQQYSIGDQMRRLLRLISKVPAESMRNRVEFLGTWG